MTLTTIIILSICVAISIGINIFFYLYIKKTLVTVVTASEEASEIFSMFDSYGEHLQSVYEMPLFYGDETLQGLLEHTRNIIDYMKRYEEVYSFTQPDLEEQLLAASQDLLNDDDNEKATEETN